MSFEEFKKIWDEQMGVVPFVFVGSESLLDALVAEANGDHSIFDEVERRLGK